MNTDTPSESASYGRQLIENTAYALANTVKARLDRQIESAERQLKDAKRAKELLAAHPEIEELLNILQKGLY